MGHQRPKRLGPCLPQNPKLHRTQVKVTTWLHFLKTHNSTSLPKASEWKKKVIKTCVQAHVWFIFSSQTNVKGGPQHSIQNYVQPDDKDKTTVVV